MSTMFDIGDQLYIKRQRATDKMGDKFYKGEMWFINAAMRWLPRVLGTLCVERRDGAWHVRVSPDAEESVTGDTLEHALLEAVLATKVPPAM